MLLIILSYNELLKSRENVGKNSFFITFDSVIKDQKKWLHLNILSKEIVTLL